MKGIVDRIEGDFLIVELENNEMIDIPIEKARQAKDGDVLLIEEDSITIDKKETEKRGQHIRSLFNELLE